MTMICFLSYHYVSIADKGENTTRNEDKTLWQLGMGLFSLTGKWPKVNSSYHD